MSTSHAYQLQYKLLGCCLSNYFDKNETKLHQKQLLKVKVGIKSKPPKNGDTGYFF